MLITEKPNIVDVIQSEGIGPKRKGKHYWALCPFHAEKTPSFIVNHDRQTAHCFSCGWHGDAITFIEDLKGLGFRGACEYLGITSGSPSLEMRKKIEREKTKRKLLEGFRQWERIYHSDLCSQYRYIQGLKSQCRTMEEVEKNADLYHFESVLMPRIEILESPKKNLETFTISKEVVNENNGKIRLGQCIA